MVSAIDLFTQTARAATEISDGGILRSKLILFTSSVSSKVSQLLKGLSLPPCAKTPFPTLFLSKCNNTNNMEHPIKKSRLERLLRPEFINAINIADIFKIKVTT
jgi:hypothetical protein